MEQGQIQIDNKDIENVLWTVTDPEIPVLSVLDMGIIRGVEKKDENVLIKITPTYSGCPAMDTIAMDIKFAVDGLGYKTEIELVLAPAWTTDWITENGRKKLEEYGIAAPLEGALDKRAIIGGESLVKCTLCGSKNTELTSQFGSTACKALFKCKDCLEPFDYFKCLK